MITELKKYMGYQVEIIYIDRYNKLSHRLIQLHLLKGNFIKAYCFQQRALRTFRVENILSMSVKRKYAV
jgi:predicted DNA-binding transcriptional regulator YafY